ncbi:hypothetical protein [Methyloligella halotolerans]|uniref:hypothetical protein n=1 Tax=Methyloligella halotolerans TaxID=1177755 RepID=UPI00114CDCBA|nr:hypothetical protein [Methyloligella halotolerans]
MILTWRAAAAAVIWMALATPVPAQELTLPAVDYPTLPSKVVDVEQFVPDGWRLEAQASGDLNKDVIEDRVLVLHESDQANVIEHDQLGESPLDTNPRMLAVAFGGMDGGYKLAAADHALIPRWINPVMEDPFDAEEGIAIDRGAFQVTLNRFFSAGSWEMGDSSFTFRWEDGGFKLIGYDWMSVRRNTGELETTSSDYLTGRVKLTHGRIDSDEEAVEWERLKPAPLLRLDQVGDGLNFDRSRAERR